MKRTILRCAAGLLIAAALLPTALAAEPFPAVTEVQVCYPTSITRSEDGTEIRKVYDLSPEQDPAGIPRSDFEQDGFHYTLTDLLQQELPEHESRPHTETVSLESKSKDMESVLALLPQDVLAMATREGAKALGRKTGRIAPGYVADLILVDFDRPNLIPCHDTVENLVYAAHGADVCMNMARGRVIYQNGAFLTIDLDRVKREIRDYALPLLFG